MRILRYEEVDSTNEAALRAIESGCARDGDVHVARTQTAGRGRRGRGWISPAGEGLYLSYVHVPRPPIPRPEVWTPAAGLAVLDAVEGLGLGDAELEWPNDVVVRGAKLAGILVETRGAGSPRAFVVGVGLNVAQRAFPEGLTAERAVTSLALQGIEVPLEEALRAILEPLPARLDQARREPAATLDAFAVRCRLSRRHLLVRSAAGAVEGRLEGIDPVHGLVLVAPNGQRRRIPLAHVLEVRRLAGGRRGAVL